MRQCRLGIALFRLHYSFVTAPRIHHNIVALTVDGPVICPFGHRNGMLWRLRCPPPAGK